jgi:hypothetical protein
MRLVPLILPLRRALAVVALAAGSAGAQSPTSAIRPDSAPLPRLDGLTAILLGEVALETERGGDSAAASRVARAANAIARGYRTVARDPALTNDVLARAVTNWFARRRGTATPAEISAQADEQLLRLMLLQTAQNVRLVEQNDRIIQLLEAIAARPR